MRNKFKVLGVALAVAALVAFGLVGTAFAASPQTSGGIANACGEPGDGTGPGDMHRWSQEPGNAVPACVVMVCAPSPVNCTSTVSKMATELATVSPATAQALVT